MKKVFFALVLTSAGCDLEERAELLIGRKCEPDAPMPCDEGQKCLPHSVNDNGYSELRCRDRASFEDSFEGSERRPAPLAYCDEEAGFECPVGLVCNADRIRGTDASVRLRVCKRPNDPFGPPLDAGPAW